MIEVYPIDRGPHRGRWAWKLETPPAYRFPKNARTPRRYQRHGIAASEVHARLTALRQLRIHAEASEQ